MMDGCGDGDNGNNGDDGDVWPCVMIYDDAWCMMYDV